MHGDVPFVLFDHARNNRFSITGIPGTVDEGTLYVVRDSLHVTEADFSRDVALIARAPNSSGNPDAGGGKGPVEGSGPSRLRIPEGKGGCAGARS